MPPRSSATRTGIRTRRWRASPRPAAHRRQVRHRPGGREGGGGAAILAGEDGSAPAPPKSTKPGVDPFVYYVQVGAFTKAEDAEQKRAGLALLGFSAKVTEREQSGRTMYRVRLGPYPLRDEAESTQTKLQLGGETAALVRVER
jgi:cell division protein FtsN